MITHLISITEFVKLLEKDINKNGVTWTLAIIVKYTDFILQKPTKENCKLYFKNNDIIVDNHNTIESLMKGYTYHKGKLELTETALKQIGL